MPTKTAAPPPELPGLGDFLCFAVYSANLACVQRRRDARDERQVIVQRTDAGRALREKGAQRTLVAAT